MQCGIGQPPDEILNIPGVIKFSPSAMLEFLKSPKHYEWKYIKKIEKEKTKAMETGSKVHMAILEPHRFHAAYARSPRPEDFKNLLTTATHWKEICKELGLKQVGNKEEIKRRVCEIKPELKEQDWDWILEKAAAGRALISPDEFDAIRYLKESFETDSDMRELFSRAYLKEKFCWIYDSELNMLFRFVMDFVSTDGVIVDLKQCPSAQPEAFDNKIARENLHVQAAMYYDFGVILSQHLKEMAFPKPTGFAFAAFEFQPPYCWQAVVMRPEFMSDGQGLYRDGIMRFLECHRTNTWPPYVKGYRDANMPNWYRWKAGERDHKKLDEAFEAEVENAG